MENEKPETTTSLVESLPADSSWLTFFKTDYFGKNYCNFKGRASRREWWATAVLLFIFKLLLGLVDGVVANDILSMIITLFISFYFIIPNVAITVRRCHDLNWSAKKILYAFIPLFLLLLIGYINSLFPNMELLPSGRIFTHIKLVAWILLGVISLYPALLLLCLPSFKGDRKDNQFGKNIYKEDK